MLQLEELKQALLAQQPKIQDLREALGCDKLLEDSRTACDHAKHRISKRALLLHTTPHDD